MLFFLCTCICLSFSAFYELLEWQLAANFYADDPAGWLGMQGDQWDAQCDMSMALLGAISSQILFARVQDRALELERKNIS